MSKYMEFPEEKYRQLFLKKFYTNETLFESELQRCKKEYGNTYEMKVKFFSETFKTLMAQFKKELPKDIQYPQTISTLYNIFISALEEDGIDSQKFQQELEVFRTEIKSNDFQQISVEAEDSLPTFKKYNLNTKYGRKKAREQAASNYENGTEEYKREIDNIGAFVWIIVIIIGAVIALIKYR